MKISSILGLSFWCTKLSL